MYVEEDSRTVSWSIPEFAWMDGGKPQKIAVRIAGLWTDILTRGFSNTKEEG
jgi:hypothetical protein